MSLTLGANANYYGDQNVYTIPLQPHHQQRGLTDWTQARPASPRNLGHAHGTVSFIDDIPLLYQQAQHTLEREIDELRRSYTFGADNEIATFLADHRAIRIVLREAVIHLKATFGEGKIFDLQLSIDEDQSRILYAVAIWPADARTASEAFDRFVENWWLDRMTAATSDLAFAYKLV